MRIFHVMMNGSEQWDDSMGIDETRMKWKQIQQFNILKFFELKPLNSSKFKPKTMFPEDKQMVFHQWELLKEFGLLFYDSVQIIIYNQDK